MELASRAGARAARSWPPVQLDALLQGIESELLSRALRAGKGNKTKAAELLGISRARLHRRCHQLGLEAAPARDTPAGPPPVARE